MHLINVINCTLCTLLLSFIIFFDISSALRDVRVQIPHAVKRSEKATLKCLYDLEGDSLYSVKWYKGRREFYSFTPKESPAMKVFQFAGVKVDRSFSNESQLVLEAVNAATSGKYSCEVSADAPSFHTLIGAGELEVVVVPGKDPVITGIRPRYKVGDIVRGNCTSSHSRPAANITWTVNGYETNPAHIRHYKPLKDPRELETVISSIHFVVTPQHFIYGKLKIRCTAHIHDVYWKSTEKSIEENRFGKAGSVNVVQTFSEDYFDLEEGNVVDRSDTYMTHIKGDVSSLNASGSTALHKCSCFWPRLTTLSLILYAVQQMFQLLQQLFGQQTTMASTSCSTATKSTVEALAEQELKQRNTSNCQIIQKRKININNENGKNVLTTIKQQQQQQQQRHLSGTLIATQVATICDDKLKMCIKKQDPAQYWPKEKYFQIMLIKKKQQNEKDKKEQDKVQFQNKQHLPHKEQQQQHKYLKHLQQECDKTPYEDYNLTMTTQVANIFNTTSTSTCATVAAACNIIVLAVDIVKNATTYSYWYKACFPNHNLYAQYCQQRPTNTLPPPPPSPLTAITTTTIAATCASNSTSKDFFLTATRTFT